MKTTRDYLDAVAARLGGVSDYRVAMTLGVSQQAVSKWRTGKDSIGDDAAIKVASILGVDPVEILMVSRVERTTNAAARSAWENAIRKLGGAAAALLLSCFALFSSTSDALASTRPSSAEAGGVVYYVKRLRRLAAVIAARLAPVRLFYPLRHKFA